MRKERRRVQLKVEEKPCQAKRERKTCALTFELVKSEGVSDVAIQTAFSLLCRSRKLNSRLDCHGATRLAMTRLVRMHRFPSTLDCTPDQQGEGGQAGAFARAPATIAQGRTVWIWLLYFCNNLAFFARVRGFSLGGGILAAV
ncbi:MAG: hypothetical protein LBC37_03290 [Zoogloeaceae bacterium]|jgi:hypothetical protein|nr:hypothetical protein [Zoogloeaceae bacterium]